MIKKNFILIILIIGVVFSSLYLIKPFYYDFIKYPLSFMNILSQRIKKINPLYKMKERIKKQQHLIEKLQTQLYTYHEMEKELTRLKKLLALKEKINYPTISAEVIAYLKQSGSEVLILNKGKKDGIKRNQPVVSYGGLVGRILESYPKISRVVLITDYSSKITVRDARTREVGLLVGRGDNFCQILYLDPQSEAKIGDLILTAGLGVFPKGIAIGKITEINWDESLTFKKAMVRPVVNLNKVEEVLVILK